MQQIIIIIIIIIGSSLQKKMESFLYSNFPVSSITSESRVPSLTDFSSFHWEVSR